ncbi:MAG TPA: HAD-IIIC family phosphatase [Pyrinomonadaceae bacterium]|nr:HAD-IIIC family phosphatase [Pyrinomonadaceae bacterium]
MSLLERRLRWQKISRAERSIVERVAVLATFTVNPLVPYLGTALEDAARPAEVMVGPYNQVVQECLDEESRTAQFKPTALVVWPRLEDLWRGLEWPLTGGAQTYTERAMELAEAALDGARRMSATLLFVLPDVPESRPLGIGDACSTTGVFATAALVRESLRRKLSEQPGTLILDAEEVIRRIGTGEAYNPGLQVVADIPYTEQLFHQVGERMTRLLMLSRRAARKLMVVDADNTLWGGVVGEDGAGQLNLEHRGTGNAFLEFQSYLLELRRAGLLIALSSKNDERDAWDAFSRPEMRLKREHLSAWRINWNAKSAALREIAEELSLGLDSIVFVDDSPAEIAEVEAALPEVACIRMPEDPARWLSAMQDAGCLDRLPPTVADLTRAAQYTEERARREHQKQQPARDYLSNLGVRVSIFEPKSADLPRLAQLISKTNQFNLNCKRRSATQLSSLCEDAEYRVRLAEVEDKFGQYGAVGAVIVRMNGHGAELDTFLLSCRAMGRGVEEAMMASIFAELDEAGRAELWATLEEHPRNEPARRFFAQLGCKEHGITSRLSRPDWPSHIAHL